MPGTCQNRFTIIGPAKDLKKFYHRASWISEIRARFLELLEKSPGRYSWQFETDEPPLQFLKQLSVQWPGLMFFLDYEREEERIKGSALMQCGKIRHSRFKY